MWARKTRTTALADTLVTDHPGRPRHVHTAIWSDATHRIFTGHTASVHAVAARTGQDPSVPPGNVVTDRRVKTRR